MIAILKGRLTQLVRRETPAGVVFEFWIEATGGGGPARAAEQIGSTFREGDLVELEGERDPSGVLEAKAMRRIVAKPSRLPRWLRPPQRRLLLAVPAVAFFTYVIVANSTSIRDRSEGTTVPSGARCLLWVTAGAGLMTYARKKIRSHQRLLLVETAAATMAGISAATYLRLGDLIQTVQLLLFVASVLAAITLMSIVVYERLTASPDQPNAGTTM
ncbi:MAG TPA: hypothetical protein VEK56_11945 [Vicinamibacterales bacterium]|nr:hypothetical protein [Vicinamibacterales bacterium]